MIATTISSSMSVKPFWLRTFMTFSSQKSFGRGTWDRFRRPTAQPSGRRRALQQPGCHGDWTEAAMA
jgi:hypothetical protein